MKKKYQIKVGEPKPIQNHRVHFSLIEVLEVTEGATDPEYYKWPMCVPQNATKEDRIAVSFCLLEYIQRMHPEFFTDLIRLGVTHKGSQLLMTKKWVTPNRIKMVRALETARKQGMRIGLRTAHKIVNSARLYQDGRSKSPSIKDPSIQGEHEFSASTLHAICLKLQIEIKKAGEK